jgi:HPt (histidine-containing phosphotransfer) domain-containing protein
MPITAVHMGHATEAAMGHTDAHDPGNTPHPLSATAASWSADAMIERLGGDEQLARQLVSLFLEEYPRLIAQLKSSVGSGQADAVRRAAHAAKGCIANFIEGGPQATAHSIEQLAAGGRVADAAALVARLETEIAGLVQPMTKFERESSCAS